LNCGGIANITVITGISDNDIIGFDTGPGNVLIDQYIRIHTGESMDKDGKYGNKGEVNKKLFTILAEKAIAKDKINYLNVRPPKSLDAGDFNLIPELSQLKFEDACATLEAFTAYTIVESLKLIDVKLPKKWVLAGGGWNNPIITSKLREYFNEQIGSDVEIVKADQIGWDSKYIEAELFAYLAARSLYKLPISYPKTTNARCVTFGGHAYLPENKNQTQAVEYLLKINPSVLSGYKRN
jgi:anhydro-N-acetylmuramic acid kinase